jgi:serine/threonine-protein kinase
MSEGGEDPALIGRTVAGKFLIEEFLGGGAMGAVYRAQQTALEKSVAVKVMHRSVATDPSFAQRFHREAKAASRLDHPNSMRVIDFGEEPDGILYIAMEYLEGRDLFRVLKEDGPLSNERIVDILSQALAAIAVAHDMGVIHRDLKPENIMVLRGKDDEGRDADVVKVCDFGIAKLVESDDAPKSSRTNGPKLSTTGLVVGTPEYMSPEQAKGEKLDARTGLYGMGVILYQLLTGRTPFTGDTPLAIVVKHVTEHAVPPHVVHPGVHRGLEAVCLKAMAKLPAERFESARAMRAALRAALDGRPAAVDGSAPTFPGPMSAREMLAAATAATIAEMPVVTAGTIGTATPAAPKRRMRTALFVALAMLVLGAAGGAVFVVQSREGARDAPASTPGTARPQDRASAPVAVVPAAVTKEPATASETTTPKHAAGATRLPPGKTAPDAGPNVVASASASSSASASLSASAMDASAPAPAFDPATCRAEQESVTAHGVALKELAGLSHAVDAWTACARTTLKEKPATPIHAAVNIQFHDARAFRGATCSGCPASIAACVQSSTEKNVSLQAKSGDVTGEASFDVAVTFTCD